MLDLHKTSILIRTFRYYFELVFLPYIKHMLQDVVRVDVVWDIYKENSLKTQTRQAMEVVIISGLITPLRFLQTGITFFVVMK